MNKIKILTFYFEDRTLEIDFPDRPTWRGPIEEITQDHLNTRNKIANIEGHNWMTEEATLLIATPAGLQYMTCCVQGGCKAMAFIETLHTLTEYGNIADDADGYISFEIEVPS